MKCKNFIIIALMVLSGYIMASAQHSFPVIEVSGSSTIRIVPDRITIEIGMEEYFKPALKDSVKVTIAEIERDVRKLLSGAGVADSRITVTDIGNYIDRNSSSKFLMAKRLSALLTDYGQLDEISKKLPDSGVNSFSISKLDNSNMERYNKEGLKAALDAARVKAEFIAANENLPGLTVWKVEETSPIHSVTNAYSNVAYEAGSGMDHLRSIERRYSVKVTYLIHETCQ